MSVSPQNGHFTCCPLEAWMRLRLTRRCRPEAHPNPNLPTVPQKRGDVQVVDAVRAGGLATDGERRLALLGHHRACRRLVAERPDDVDLSGEPGGDHGD